MIRFLCPTCSAKVQAPEARIQQSGRCPKCGGMFVVPPTSAPQFAHLNASPVFRPMPPLQPASAQKPIQYFQPAFSPAPVHAAAFAPPPAAANPSRKYKYLVPIIIVGVLLLAGVFFLSQAIDDQNDRTLADFRKAGPQLNPEPNPTPTYTPPTPTPQRNPTPQYNPTIPYNRPQPQRSPQPQRTYTPSVTPNPLPRPRVRPNLDPRLDPPPEIRSNPSFRRLVPLKRFGTSPLLRAPIRVDDKVYFASRDGDLYTIDIESLEMAEKKLQNPVKRLYLSGSQLKAAGSGGALTVFDFNKQVAVDDPQDIEAFEKPSLLGGQPIPPAWFQRQPNFRQVVLYKGKYYQPAAGSVRVLNNGEIIEYRSIAPAVSHWKIALPPSGPIGYDNLSFYELNENLCPIRRLFTLRNDRDNPDANANDCMVAGDGQTLCFAQGSGSSKRMMIIWSADGKRKIREEYAPFGKDGDEDELTSAKAEYRAPSGRLVALAGGYLFCGRWVIWMPSTPGMMYNFRPPEETPPDVARRFGLLNLTPPLIVGKKIFVGSPGGAIYVFDTSAFSSGSQTSGGTSGSGGGL